MIQALTLEEAVALGYAVVIRVLSDSGVRALAIKGPFLAQQGLRPPKPSIDIDVLVEPAGFDTARAALEAIGWHDGGSYETPGIVPLHSVNHRHPHWPCEADLHRWFPGFLADPAAVFDVLWERRESGPLAHVELPVPDVVGHAALAALHYLRDRETAWGRSRLEELAERIERGWSPGQRSELVAVAAETGSSHSLGPLLTRLGLEPTGTEATLVVAVDDWEMRSRSTVSEVVPWLVGLRRTPWHRRPLFVLSAFWLPDEHFRDDRGAPLDSRRALARARWARAKRGLRALPRAWAEYRRLSGDGRA